MMNAHTRLYKSMIVLSFISIPVLAFSSDSQLLLKHGVYVRASSPCKGAPNASIMSWDGAAFSGAHTSACSSRVLRQDEGKFQITTTCAALGDGSPAAAPAVMDSFSLIRISSTRFKILKDNQAQGTFRWCSVNSVD